MVQGNRDGENKARVSLKAVLKWRRLCADYRKPYRRADGRWQSWRDDLNGIGLAFRR